MNEDHPDSRNPDQEKTLLADDRPHKASETIGNFRISQEIGEGGMGVVYDAEQLRPVRRRVALKVIKLGMDTREVVARFESERQALALMNHPHIARVYDAGTTREGRPYFAMEFVNGIPITDYCDQNRMSIPERLKLFIKVCGGVQHAHQKGIIHRDIKPSNVLVGAADGKHVPKIIDFGIAKATAQRLTEKTLFTGLGQVIGTPEYLSPEQADLGGMDVDTRTDVYLLGELLYVLLTGQAPFGTDELRELGFNEFRRRIIEVEPAKPSTRVADAVADVAGLRQVDSQALPRRLKGDLDWITMKALEKDRTRRYASVSELANDVGRFLKHEPVLAGPPSNIYKIRKFVRRHKASAILGTVLFVVLTSVAIAMTVQAKLLSEAKDNLEHEATTASDVSDFLIELFTLADPGEAQGNSVTARELLDRSVEEIDSLDNDRLKARMMNSMGRAYSGLGLDKEALSLLERSFQMRFAMEDPDPLALADTMDTLAGLYWVHERDFSRAEEMYREALKLRTENLDPDDPGVATAMNNLGSLLASAGRPGAEELHNQAYEIRVKSLPKDHPDLAISMTNRGLYFKRDGHYATARTLLVQAKEIVESKFGLRDPRYTDALERLGHLCEAEGKFAEAQKYHLGALRFREQIFAPDHAKVAHSNLALAIVSLHQDDPAGAEKLHRKASEIYARTEQGQSSFVLYRKASYEAMAGERAAALRLLRGAVVNQQYSDVDSLRRDPNFASLRDDYEFLLILDAVRQRQAGG